MGLCMAAQKGPFVLKYYVVLSPTAPEHPSVLPQGRGQKQTGRWRREKESGKIEHKEREVRWNKRMKGAKWEKSCHVMLTVAKGREIWDWSQVQCSYLYSQDVFSKLCCQTEKASECWTGSYKNLTTVTQWVLNWEPLKLHIVYLLVPLWKPAFVQCVKTKQANLNNGSQTSDYDTFVTEKHL